MITAKEIKNIWQGIEEKMLKDENVTAEDLNSHCRYVAATIRELKKKKK